MGATLPLRNFSPRRTAARAGSSSPDRKSTRLNSSHGYISYAVFCLKKKSPLLEGSCHRALRKFEPEHAAEQAEHVADFVVSPNAPITLMLGALLLLMGRLAVMVLLP